MVYSSFVFIEVPDRSLNKISCFSTTNFFPAKLVIAYNCAIFAGLYDVNFS